MVQIVLKSEAIHNSFLISKETIHTSEGYIAHGEKPLRIRTQFRMGENYSPDMLVRAF